MVEEPVSEEEISSKRKYEIMVVILPGLGEEQTKKELDTIREDITSEGGEIFFEDIWGQRDIAYKIKGEEKGFYAVFDVNMEQSKIKEVDNSLHLNQKLLRYIILKTPYDYESKTLKFYEEEAEKMRKEKEKAKQEAKEKKEKKNFKPLPRKKKEVATEKEVEVEKEVKEKPVKEESEKMKEKEEVKEVKKEETKKKESNLEDLDKKLKSIIDDPDITL